MTDTTPTRWIDVDIGEMARYARKIVNDAKHRPDYVDFDAIRDVRDLLNTVLDDEAREAA